MNKESKPSSSSEEKYCKLKVTYELFCCSVQLCQQRSPSQRIRSCITSFTTEFTPSLPVISRWMRSQLSSASSTTSATSMMGTTPNASTPAMSPTSNASTILWISPRKFAGVTSTTASTSAAHATT